MLISANKVLILYFFIMPSLCLQYVLTITT